MLSFTYLFINFIVSAIVLFFMIVFHFVQNGLGYEEIVMEVKHTMKKDFLVGCVCIFLIQAISWFVTKGILG